MPPCFPYLKPNTKIVYCVKKTKKLDINSTSKLDYNDQGESDFEVTKTEICNPTRDTSTTNTISITNNITINNNITNDSNNNIINTNNNSNGSRGSSSGGNQSSGYLQTSSTSEVPASLSPSQITENFSDYQILSYNLQCLHYGKWFYGGISNADAKSLLCNSKHGTFLVRYSSSSKFLYSLSISSLQGVTSVRIAYNKGHFHLDCDAKLQKQMPHFKSIIDLVQFYSNRRDPCLLNNGHRCVWVDCNNKRYKSSELTSAKLHSVPSLAHLCRLSVNNRSMEQNRTLEVSLKEDWRDSLGLPTFLVDFLKNYPFVM